MPKTVGALAKLVGGTVHGDGSLIITGVRDLPTAGLGHLSFLINARYAAQLEATTATAVLVRAYVPRVACAQIVCNNPYLALATIMQALYTPRQPAIGAAPGAHVDIAAIIDPSAYIGPGAVIEARARIGPGCVVHALAYVGADSSLGRGCTLHPGAKVLWGCTLGEGVILQSGAIIGSDGFGYAEDDDGVRHKIPQIGCVVLADDVEIGANSCVDRATFGTTFVGAGSKIDNLVQIAHNVSLGRHCVVVSQSGIAGSTQLGDRVVMGAQGGMIGHLRVASGTTLAARTGVVASIEQPGVYGGFPAVPHAQWLRTTAMQKNLGALRQRVHALEAQLDKTRATAPHEV